MSEKRRALGRGLGALIPNAPTAPTSSRPVDVFFPDQRPADQEPAADGERSDAHQDPTGEAADGAGLHAVPDHGAWDQDGAGPDDQVATAEGDTPERGDGLAPVPGASYGEIPVSAIRPNPRQPRTVFDEDDLTELVHSIREIGVLQPVVVRPVPAGQGAGPGAEGSGGDQAAYELIMGERRWRASQQAGLETIPAIVKETEDDDLLRDALLENLHRSQLNALEEAAAYQQLLEDFGCTHDELAGRIGRSRPQISNTLRLLKLPPLVARRVAAGVLSAGHARALLSLDDGAQMERLAQRIVAEGLSVRNVEEIVAIGGDQGSAAKPRRPRAGGRHPQLDDLAARLSDRFDTRVNIALGQRKGKLTVEFASVDDLHRIVDLLGVNPRE
jgi:ParB family chromosome partitioning protein